MDGEVEALTDGALQPLSLKDMETLLAALDPRLEGFGEGPSCLDDARAFLARLASSRSPADEEGTATNIAAMEDWIESWRTAGGNRQTLRILVQTLIAERLGSERTGSPMGPRAETGDGLA
jgi:hypothetical protein